MGKKGKPNEIYITRVYDAEVKDVWDAWTDTAQVAQWWGPRGFTITTHSKDLRVGGHWSYTMHGPDGTDYENKTIYHEVEPQRKLVYDHGGNDDRPPLFRVTVLFSEIKKGKTKMDMTMALATPQAAEDTKKFIKKAGGNATWDRLAEFLAREGSGAEVFVINRSFDVSIDKMFDLWTEPKHFSKWLPPTGFNMEFIRGEIKEGSTTFFVMSDGANLKMYGTMTYSEISKPHRIVYTQQFVDENQKVSRHPFAPTWPETMMTAVTFTEEGDSQTRVTIEWAPHGAVTPAELKAFIDEKPGMTQGWTGSFDKLEELIAAKQ